MPENAVGAVPIIEGSQIFLHPLRLKDIPRLNRWRNDLTTREQLVLHPYPIPLEQDMLWFKERIAVANNRQVYFGISLKEYHELAGYANITNINWIHRTCNVGALIRKSQHKHQALGLEDRRPRHGLRLQDPRPGTHLHPRDRRQQARADVQTACWATGKKR